MKRKVNPNLYSSEKRRYVKILAITMLAALFSFAAAVQMVDVQKSNAYFRNEKESPTLVNQVLMRPAQVVTEQAITGQFAATDTYEDQLSDNYLDSVQPASVVTEQAITYKYVE